MKKAMVLAALLYLCLGTVQAGGFGLPEIDLQLTYLHSMTSGDNQTCLTASFKVAEVSKFPLNLDVIFAPDFEDFGEWGVGVSTQLTGVSSSLKLGIGLMDGLTDPVVYIGFTL